MIAVVGGKHSGKTTVIENLIRELRRRKNRLGTVKEMVQIPTLDTPATETDRYSKAGAEIIVAVPRNETVVFIKKRLDLKDILPYLNRIDFVFVEGFELENSLPKIVAAKTAKEAASYLDDSAIAVSGLIVEVEAEKKKAEEFGIPILNCLSQVKELADLAERKAALLS